MFLKLTGLVCSGKAEHSYRLAVPAGHEASVFNAVPRPADSFDLQAQDLADQFEIFRSRHAFQSGECVELTLFVNSLVHLERAVAFGKRLRGARTQTTVIANFEDPRWRITLNAYFLKRI